jgi:hypothetical protein
VLRIGPIVLGLESGDRLFQLDILRAGSIVSFVSALPRSGTDAARFQRASKYVISS